MKPDGRLSLIALLTLACGPSLPTTAAVAPVQPGLSRVAPQALPLVMQLPGSVDESLPREGSMPMVSYSGTDDRYTFGMAIIDLGACGDACDEASQEKAREAAVLHLQTELLPRYFQTSAGEIQFKGYGGLKISLEKRLYRSLEGTARLFVEFIGQRVVAQFATFESRQRFDWDGDVYRAGGMQKIQARLDGVFGSFASLQSEAAMAQLKAEYPPPQLITSETREADGWFTVSVPEAGLTLQLPGPARKELWYNRSGRQLWSVRGEDPNDKGTYCQITYVKDTEATDDDIAVLMDEEQGSRAAGPKYYAEVNGQPALDMLLRLAGGRQEMYRVVMGPSEILRVQAGEGGQQLGPKARRCLDSVQLQAGSGEPLVAGRSFASARRPKSRPTKRQGPPRLMARSF